MNIFLNGETIYCGFSNIEDIENLLIKLHNSNNKLKTPTGNNILGDDFLGRIKEKFIKFKNSNITQKELFKINNKKEVEEVDMIDPEHFFIWVVGPNNDIVSWSVRKLKEEIINEFKIININEK